jgi:hypothetical protein
LVAPVASIVQSWSRKRFGVAWLKRVTQPRQCIATFLDRPIESETLVAESTE